MVNSGSLSDIFTSAETDGPKCGEFSTICSGNSVCSVSNSSSSHRSKDRASSESYSSGKPCSAFEKSEDCEDSVSWHLHLSEESQNSIHNSDSILHSLRESQSSDDTYISKNTDCFSFEDSKIDILNNDVNTDRKVCMNSPDMFAQSQASTSSKGSNLSGQFGIKVEDDKYNLNFAESSEVNEDLRTLPSCSRTSHDDDAEGYLLDTRISEDGCSQEHVKSSQKLLQDSPEQRTSPLQELQQDCRERQEEWNIQELTRVSEGIRLRRKQTRRLILTIIRKRQMAEETLDAFKKRLKKL